MSLDTKGERTRAALVDAAIRVAACEGLAALSYRKVASMAGVSLALVNYHFPVKSELIASLSKAILDQYSRSIERVIRHIDSGVSTTLENVSSRLLGNATMRDQERTLVWAEICLEAARQPESLTLSRMWDSELQRLWTKVARATGHDACALSIRTETDLLTGMIFVCLALQIDGASVVDVLGGAAPVDPDVAPPASVPSPATRQASRKSIETSARVIEAAIDILKEQGASGISFRTIADRAGLSLTAPSYHFQSIADLLSQAQITMIERSKERYREVMKLADRNTLSETLLVDLTTTIFVREATQSASDNLAFFTSWLDAARQSELRPVIRSFVENQILAWQRVLPDTHDSATTKRSGLLSMSLFLGKLIRVISTGSATSDLVTIRDEFLYGFRVLHPALPCKKAIIPPWA